MKKKCFIMLPIILLAAAKINAQFAIAVYKPNYSPLDERYCAYKNEEKDLKFVCDYAMNTCAGDAYQGKFLYFAIDDSRDYYFAICEGKSQYSSFRVIGVGYSKNEDEAKQRALDDCRGYGKKIVRIFAPWLKSEELTK